MNPNGFERPKNRRGTPFSTQDAANFSELLSHMTYEGVGLTLDELQHLQKFYDITEERREALHRAHVENARAHAEKEWDAAMPLPRYKRPTGIQYHCRQGGSRASYIEKAVQSAEGTKVFSASGDMRGLFREVRTDGIRLMGFLARFLQRGEDPVKLVWALCIDAGYDVPPYPEEGNESSLGDGPLEPSTGSTVP